MTRSWQLDGSTFYSLIVHAPKTQLVVELISNNTGGKGRWPLQASPRHFFQGQTPPLTKPGYLFPLHVSRAVHDLQEIRDFYDKAFNVQPTVAKVFEDGTEVLVFGGIPGDTFSQRVGLQFVKRTKTQSHGRHSAQWFQAYQLNVSRTYMTSYNSCWPVWGDNHIAIRFSKPANLKDLKARLDSALEEPMYHAFHGISLPGSSIAGPSVIYVVDPSGWTVQVEGYWPDGFLPDADTDQGNFYDYCYDPKHGQKCLKKGPSVFV
jgi:catechol 2,3-dioxygenase-like lactoylglutathione lyase family enzyme